jgi:cobalt transporter subunit CbtA
MFRRVFLAAVLAGIAASLVMSALQHFRLTPLILAAEVFETQSHDHTAASADRVSATAAWAPSESLERSLYTVLANLVVGVAFALLLSGASLLLGHPITFSNGALWGLAGFLAFSLSPSAGLPPELPGMPGAELWLRQLWWAFAAAATAAGLAVIALANRGPLMLLGVAVLALPHVLGAPQAPSHETSVPAHLAAAFAVNSIAAAAVFWVVLGCLIGYLNDRRKEQALS